MLVELDVEYGKSLWKEEEFSLTRSPIKKNPDGPKNENRRPTCESVPYPPAASWLDARASCPP
jgi:hypothetical protein